MTLTLMQGHSLSAKAKNLCCVLLATKQAIIIKLVTTVGHYFTWTCHWLCKRFIYSCLSCFSLCVFVRVWCVYVYYTLIVLVDIYMIFFACLNVRSITRTGWSTGSSGPNATVLEYKKIWVQVLTERSTVTLSKKQKKTSMVVQVLAFHCIVQWLLVLICTTSTDDCLTTF